MCEVCTRAAGPLRNYMMYNGGEGLYTSTMAYEKNPHCLVCGTQGVPLTLKAEQTLQELIDFLVQVRRRVIGHEHSSGAARTRRGSTR